MNYVDGLNFFKYILIEVQVTKKMWEGKDIMEERVTHWVYSILSTLTRLIPSYWKIFTILKTLTKITKMSPGPTDLYLRFLKYNDLIPSKSLCVLEDLC